MIGSLLEAYLVSDSLQSLKEFDYSAGTTAETKNSSLSEQKWSSILRNC
ncbi:hypothetical protein GCM10011391_03100 [Pullulanibacillus camelliae]|uniref:Uncharacterized protein n=1 Tax=Pullulanibacillus camelliae TaxID=1707096 RepID=A0A8J2YF05_9BACL|nr:hypothetical protein GCM10011391_03100 [Pullulanibacillus camelliae]